MASKHKVQASERETERLRFPNQRERNESTIAIYPPIMQNIVASNTPSYPFSLSLWQRPPTCLVFPESFT